jgi:hypothetical protein
MAAQVVEKSDSVIPNGVHGVRNFSLITRSDDRTTFSAGA